MRLWPLLLAMTQLACTTIPEGTFACMSDDECPEDWSCRVDARCYASDTDQCTGICGDVVPDRELTPADAQRLTEIVGAEKWNPYCALSQGDIVHDGELTDADVGALFQLLSCPPTAPPCPGCSWPCGDANLDGQVDQDDAGTIRDIAEQLAMMGSPCLCALFAADVDGDAGVTDADVDRLNAHLVNSMVPLECAQP